MVVLRLQSDDMVKAGGNGIQDPNFRQLVVIINSRSSDFKLQLPTGMTLT